jgi:septal ring factor EnvC (AmiA/AmiB activator)
MTDTLENHTIRLLQEMRAENRERHEKFEASLADIKSALASVKSDTTQIAAEVTQLGADMQDVKARLERIERHTGMVKT